MCLVKLKVIVKKLGKNWNNCLNCFSNFYVKLKYVNFLFISHVKKVIYHKLKIFRENEV